MLSNVIWYSIISVEVFDNIGNPKKFATGFTPGVVWVPKINLLSDEFADDPPS